MNKEEICDDGRCKRVRMGEDRHSKHDNGKKLKKSDKDEPFRSSNYVQGLFFALAILGGILTYLSTTSNAMDSPITKIVVGTTAFIMGGLAFAVLNRGMTIKTDDRIRRIESKLDKILEQRDNVLQNKEEN